MKYRNLCGGGPAVSEIGYGAWAIGDDWWGHIDDASARRQINRAYEMGITFFDTADGYGDGRSERLIGEALGNRRHGAVLATKFGYDKLDTSVDRSRHQERAQNFDPAFIRSSLEESLKRLRTDYVDLYQLHNPKLDAVRRDDTFACLEDLKREGKIRHYGVALGPRIGWRDEGLYALINRSVSTIHMIFNLLEQEPGAELLEAAGSTGAGAIIRVPLSSGLLAGKYTLATRFDQSDHRSHRDRAWLEGGLAKIERLGFLELGGRRSLAHAAIQFILSFPTVATVLPTIRELDEIEDFALASEAEPLTDAELGEIQRLYSAGFDLAPAPARGS